MKVENLQQTPLSKEEAQKLVDSILEKKYKALAYLGLNSGITLQEALSLKASDITAREQSIWVSEHQQGKTPSGKHRIIIVPNKVVDYLKMTLNGNIRADVVIFDMNVQNVMDDLPSLAMNALNKRIGWACIRATYAQLAIDAGHPIDLISENTGLSKAFISSAVKTMPEVKRETVNKNPLVVVK
jgi:integrase